MSKHSLASILSLSVVLAAASAQSQTVTKPPLTGLISMGQVGYATDPAGRNYNDNAAFYGIPGSSLIDVVAKRNVFDGVVINVPWSVLQPDALHTPGSDDQPVDTTAIDAALGAIRTYNADPATTRPLRAILRVWAAPNAPDWAKALGGGAVTVYKYDRIHPTFTIGRFWTADYISAWGHLQSRLAQSYDREPLIAQVSNSSCVSIDDEPTALVIANDAGAGESSLANLQAAGFSDTAYRGCLLFSAASYRFWQTTPINFPLGPVRTTDGTPLYQVPPFGTDGQTFSVALAQIWRAALGPRGVLSNHNLSPALSQRVVPTYDIIRDLGPPTEFQTHAPAPVPDSASGVLEPFGWAVTIAQGVCLHAQSIELWNDGPNGGYVEQLVPDLLQWAQELRTGVSTTPCASLPPPAAP